MRDLRLLTKIATFGTVIWLIVFSSFVINDFMRAGYFSSENTSVAEGSAAIQPQSTNTGFSDWIDYIRMPLFFLPLIINSLWIMRAARNARLQGDAPLPIRGFWLVLWLWFPVTQPFVPWPSLRRIHQIFCPGPDRWFWAMWAGFGFFVISGWVYVFLPEFLPQTEAFLERIDAPHTLAEFICLLIAGWYFIKFMRNVARAQFLKTADLFD